MDNRAELGRMVRPAFAVLRNRPIWSRGGKDINSCFLHGLFTSLLFSGLTLSRSIDLRSGDLISEDEDSGVREGISYIAAIRSERGGIGGLGVGLEVSARLYQDRSKVASIM